MTKLLKPEEAAERLAVSPKAVRAWLREGRLPGIRLGRLWRIAEDKLEEFIGGQGFEQDAAAARPPQAAPTPQNAPTRPPQIAQDERTPPRETHRPKGPQKRATPQKRKTREDLMRKEREAFERRRRERAKRERGHKRK